MYELSCYLESRDYFAMGMTSNVYVWTKQREIIKSTVNTFF